MRQFNDVIRETRRTAFTKPLFRNEKSEYYNEDGTPCCIFGHVFDRLGVRRATVNRGGVVAVLDWELMGFEKPNSFQTFWVTQVQGRADAGESWILAVALTDATPM